MCVWVFKGTDISVFNIELYETPCISTSIKKHPVYICMCVCIYVYVCVCMYVYVCVCLKELIYLSSILNWVKPPRDDMTGGIIENSATTL